MAAVFGYDPALTERFPAVVGGVLLAGVVNGSTPPRLVAALAHEVAAARMRIGATPLSELPSLAAWRRVFRGFGVDPTQYRSAAEALLRRVTKGDDLPTISALVDLANLVSVRRALPVAVFDRRAIAGSLVVAFAAGDESWADLGASTTQHPEPGEVIFVDSAWQVSARRWCWRQSRASAAREDTTSVLVTVEGHHDIAPADVTAAVGDLQGLLREFAAATITATEVLDARRPSLSTTGPGRRDRDSAVSAAGDRDRETDRLDHCVSRNHHSAEETRVATGSGTRDDPWVLRTPPGTSDYTMWRDDSASPPVIVCMVGTTRLTYQARAIEDLQAMLKKRGDWMPLGSADEGKDAAPGTVEAWGRSSDNPVGGWYGTRKGYRGRFAMYLPPLMEALGLAEVEHNPKNNRMRAK